MSWTRALGIVVSVAVVGCAGSQQPAATGSQPPSPASQPNAAVTQSNGQPSAVGAHSSERPSAQQTAAIATQPSEQPPAMIDCSEVPGRPADLPANTSERYYPRAMKNLLDRDAVLQQQYAKPQIMDCADARRFMAIYKQEEQRILGARAIRRPPPEQPVQESARSDPPTEP